MYICRHLYTYIHIYICTYIHIYAHTYSHSKTLVFHNTDILQTVMKLNSHNRGKNNFPTRLKRNNKYK